ncbi:hypothetical protein AGDE_02813 [Angomonas deanei]|nr:hypothetical protein AGDE_02813 [Angomonas deanei]|eukprot:EPY41112.1 hypothetical protein AGDE_02813 [Angomonas deanei]
MNKANPLPLKAAEEWKKPKIQEEIEEELRQLKDSILKPLDASFSFVSETTYSIPMVLLIGNHSSGKSTLINFLCGRNIQDTGVAPTDDGFTIIQRGAFDMDDDGPSSVGNLAYQFKALKSFGYTFINRFKVKTRVLPPNTNIPFNMMVVDSPGMIDTPIHVTDRTSADGQMRGYDFLAATRWFALRSDVILLMFDPANPGTTGETLDVLTRSLAGCEHKFLLVLNKVDVFEKVEDFARAYGSLCWNLSKVIKLKDMPRIFITCTPLEKGETAGKATPASIIPEEETRRQRNLILQELLAAPLRRLDNLIAETEESVENLIMSLEVCNQLRYQLFERQTMMLVTFVVSAVTVPALIYAVSTLSMSATILLSTLSVAGFYLMALLGQSNLKAFNQRLIAESDNTVHSLYGKNYTNEMHLRWINVVRPRLTKVASSRTMDGSCDIHELPKTSKRSIRQLKSLLTNDLPVLREKIVEHKRLLYKAQSNQSS